MRIPLILDSLSNFTHGPFVRVPRGCWEIVSGGSGFDMNSVTIFHDPVGSLGTLSNKIVIEGPCDLQVRYAGAEIRKANLSVFAEMISCR